MSSTTNFSRTQCQICNKFGHSALTCWSRYDNDFNNSINANTSQLCNFQPNDCDASFMGAPSVASDPLWYPNSEATHHMTNNTNNFSNKTSYHGHDVVKLGNGLGIPITDIGSAHFTLPHTNTVIHLHQLLHVPTITKNVMSVSKFAKDNDVFSEFHTNQCLVKSQATKQVLFQGKLRDGLYVFLFFICISPLLLTLLMFLLFLLLTNCGILTLVMHLHLVFIKLCTLVISNVTLVLIFVILVQLLKCISC